MQERLNNDLKRIKEQIEIGNYDRAIRISNLLINSKVPNIISLGLLYKGLALSLNKQFDEAISILNQLIESFPNSKLAYLYRCETFINIGEFEKALVDANSLIEFDQFNFQYMFTYIKVNHFLGDFQQVIDYSSKILYFYPEQKSFLLIRAKAKGRIGLYEEALIDYKKVLKEIQEERLMIDKSKIVNLFNDMGYYYGKVKAYQLAIIHLEKALKFDDKHPCSLNNLGFILAQIGQYDLGLKLINKSLKLNSSNSYAFKNRAKILISKGQFNKAKDDLLKAKKLEYHLLYDNEVDILLNQLNRKR